MKESWKITAVTATTTIIILTLHLGGAAERGNEACNCRAGFNLTPFGGVHSHYHDMRLLLTSPVVSHFHLFRYGWTDL
jgi:hypothetical protein